MKEINFLQLIKAISLSIDLAECSTIQEMNFVEERTNINYSSHNFSYHTQRTCYVAVNIAKKITPCDDFYLTTYLSSTLHDIGISSGIKSAHSDDTFIKDHCIRGSEFAKQLKMENEIYDNLYFHHEDYDGSGPFSLSGTEIPLVCRIIRLADTFELLYDSSLPNYVQRDEINNFIKSYSGTIFDPYIVELYFDIQSKDKFWWDIEHIGFLNSIMDDVQPATIKHITLNDLKSVSHVLADIIDSKSSFTYKHSTRLAEIIEDVSNYLGFNDEKKNRFVISALLHDIGKIAIPNSILNKNGKLDKTEFTIMKSHTYYTRRILSKINDIEDIVNWGANHHEKLDGTGYPLGLTSKDISLEESLMAVCDIYEALSSKRPYKKSLSNSDVFKIIDSMVQDNKICPTAFSILKKTL